MGAEQWAHAQAVLDDYQSQRRLPGIVAAIYDHGELAWSGASGEADASRQYRIGSITKTLTAVLVMQCRDEGLVSLDDRLDTVIPESGQGARTLRELLSHTAGIPSEPAGDWWERSPGVDIDTLLLNNTNVRDPFAPGEEFHYSNLGFALLGEVVARLRGASWYDVLSERVLGPLAMTRTSYLPSAPHASGFSVDHFAGTLTREPHQDSGAMAPAGQLWSTVGDLTHLLDLLCGAHRDVLAPASLAQMLSPIRGGYGLGIMRFEGEGWHLAGHLGSMPGFQAAALVDPGRGRGVVALTNGTTGFSGEEIALRLLGEGAVPPAEPWRPTVAVPSWAGELLGIWFWGDSAFECRWSNERLELHDLARRRLAERFEMRAGELVGTLGYHHGEILHVHHRPSGAISHLECATFVYTRHPYDSEVHIPGGHPAP